MRELSIAGTEIFRAPFSGFQAALFNKKLTRTTKWVWAETEPSGFSLGQVQQTIAWSTCGSPRINGAEYVRLSATKVINEVLVANLLPARLQSQPVQALLFALDGAKNG